MIRRLCGTPYFQNSRVNNRRATLVLQRLLNVFIKYMAVLIDGAPQAVFVDVNADPDIIELPSVIPAGLLAAQMTCMAWPEFLSPAPDRFV